MDGGQMKCSQHCPKVGTHPLEAVREHLSYKTSKKIRCQGHSDTFCQEERFYFLPRFLSVDCHCCRVSESGSTIQCSGKLNRGILQPKMNISLECSSFVAFVCLHLNGIKRKQNNNSQSDFWIYLTWAQRVHCHSVIQIRKCHFCDPLIRQYYLDFEEEESHWAEATMVR